MDNIQSYNLEEINKVCKTIPIPTIVVDSENLLLANMAFVEFLGYEADEINKIDWWNNTVEYDKDYYKRLIQGLLDNLDLNLNREVKFRCKEKGVVWANYAYKKILVDGKLYLLLTFSNITKEKRTEIKLQTYIKLRQSMLELTQKMMGNHSLGDIYEIIMDVAIENINGVEFGSVMVVNGDYMRVVACRGFNEEALIGFKLPIKDTFIYQATEGKFDKTVIINDLDQDERIKFSYDQDESSHLRSTISSPIYVDGKLFGLVNVDATKVNRFSDADLITMNFIRTNLSIGIKQHLNINEKVYLSRYDGLTNIYNRSHFERIIIQKLRNLKADSGVYLVMFDLDNLKFINDTFGHMAGDKMITHFATGLKLIKQGVDVLGRYGGDEFVAVFWRNNETELVEELEDLRNSLINMPVKYKDNTVETVFSYGYATYGKDAVEYRSLVRTADARMYNYKHRFKKAY